MDLEVLPTLFGHKEGTAAVSSPATCQCKLRM